MTLVTSTRGLTAFTRLVVLATIATAFVVLGFESWGIQRGKDWHNYQRTRESAADPAEPWTSFAYDRDHDLDVEVGVGWGISILVTAGGAIIFLIWAASVFTNLKRADVPGLNSSLIALAFAAFIPILGIIFVGMFLSDAYRASTFIAGRSTASEWRKTPGGLLAWVSTIFFFGGKLVAWTSFGAVIESQKFSRDIDLVDSLHLTSYVATAFMITGAGLFFMIVGRIGRSLEEFRERQLAGEFDDPAEFLPA
jgi:hypothetical protein